MGTLEEGKCYLLINFVVREYGTKLMSMAIDESHVHPIDDIGDMFAPDDLVKRDEEEIWNVEIGAVSFVEQYKACIRCKGQVEPGKRGFGRSS